MDSFRQAVVGYKLRHEDGRCFDILTVFFGGRLYIQRTVEVLSLDQWMIPTPGGRLVGMGWDDFKVGLKVYSLESHLHLRVLAVDGGNKAVVGECLIVSDPKPWQLLIPQ